MKQALIISKFDDNLEKQLKSTANLYGTFIYLFSLLFMAGVFFAQTGKKTNLEILEQDLTAEIEKLLYFPDVDRSLQFVCYVSRLSKDKSGKKFVESLLKKTAEKNNLRISFAGDESMTSVDSIYNKMSINILKLRTSYPSLIKNRFLGEKSLRREVTSELDINISSGSGRVLLNEKVTTSHKDEIPYDGYETYQSEEYLFTQSMPPDISWLETIIFPSAVVVVSAVVTVLFFTIRSK